MQVPVIHEIAGAEATGVCCQLVGNPGQGPERPADVLSPPFGNEPPILEDGNRVSVEARGRASRQTPVSFLNFAHQAQAASAMSCGAPTGGDVRRSASQAPRWPDAPTRSRLSLRRTWYGEPRGGSGAAIRNANSASARRIRLALSRIEVVRDPHRPATARREGRPR